MEPIVAGGGGAAGGGSRRRRGRLASTGGGRWWRDGEAAVASVGLGDGRGSPKKAEAGKISPV